MGTSGMEGVGRGGDGGQERGSGGGGYEMMEGGGEGRRERKGRTKEKNKTAYSCKTLHCAPQPLNRKHNYALVIIIITIISSHCKLFCYHTGKVKVSIIVLL